MRGSPQVCNNSMFGIVKEAGAVTVEDKPCWEMNENSGFEIPMNSVSGLSVFMGIL